MYKVCIFTVFTYFVFHFSACQDASTQVTRIDKETFTAIEQQQIGEFLKSEIASAPQEFPHLRTDIYTSAQSYVESLLETLLVSAHVAQRSTFDWTVTIIQDDDMRNAFTLPGGKIYLYTGLLKYLKSEHELLSVIAHEIAHTDTEHIINRLKAEYGGVLLGDILLDNEISSAGEMARNLPKLVLATDEVIAADVYAVNLICDYAWDARGLKQILERTEETESDIQWLQTRQGDVQQRIEMVENTALPCGFGGETFDDRYATFVNEWLPQ